MKHLWTIFNTHVSKNKILRLLYHLKVLKKFRMKYWHGFEIIIYSLLKFESFTEKIRSKSLLVKKM